MTPMDVVRGLLDGMRDAKAEFGPVMWETVREAEEGGLGDVARLRLEGFLS